MSDFFLIYVTVLIFIVVFSICFSIVIKPMQSLLLKIILGIGIFVVGIGGYGLVYLFTNLFVH